MARWSRTLSMCSVSLGILLVACGGGSDDAGSTGSGGLPFVDISQACPLPEPGHLAIQTQAYAPIKSKDDYIPAVLTFWGFPGIEAEQILQAQVRGRGHSTWLMEKRPYKLKLDDKTELLGMPWGKQFALLANHADKTLLRNELALCMARDLELPYSPQSRFLELELNGSHDGLYQLTNKTYEVDDLVKADNELGPQADALGVFSDAFLLELDFVLRRDDHFVTAGGVPLQFRSKTDAAQMERVATSFSVLEGLITNAGEPMRLDKLSRVLDLQSMVDFYLLQELAANPDGFKSSTYLYRRRGGKLTYGPVWDFDQAFGPTVINVVPEGWIIANKAYNWYLRELLAEPEFAALVRARWQYILPRVTAYIQFIFDAAERLDETAQRNFQRWPILGELVFTNVFAFDTYDEEVDFMAGWLQQRAQWMNRHMPELTAAADLGAWFGGIGAVQNISGLD